MDRNVSIHTVSGTNALTGAVQYAQKPMSASAPSELNKPVFSEVNIKPEICMGILSLLVFKIFSSRSAFYPEQNKDGPAPVWYSEISDVDGSSDNPVTVSGLDSMPWGTFALIENKPLARF